jgi:hypothetical protein
MLSQIQKPTSLMQNVAAAGMQPGTTEYQQMMQEAIMKPATEINMAKMPTGYVRQGEGMRPVQGSPDYVKAQQEVNSASTGISTVDMMIKSIDESGSEMYGPESGRQAQLYGQILSEIAKLRDLGVLQPGEVEMMQDQLTDPSTMAGATTSKATMLAQYKQVRKMLDDKLKGKMSTYSKWGIKQPTFGESQGVSTITPEAIQKERERRRNAN